MEPQKFKITLVVGAPGSGKGTVCEEFAEKRNYLHISTGDLCRELVEQGTELGRQISVHMDSGKFIPDDLMFQG